jgi:hypothetical protein
VPSAFSSSLKAFTTVDRVAALGQLSSAQARSGFATHYTRQTDAWEKCLPLLQEVCRSLLNRDASAGAWHLLLEYEIPRRQKRIDAVLLACDVILVIEFKVDALSFEQADLWQAEDYALDLRDFHEQSQDRPIIPLLVATETTISPPLDLPHESRQRVYPGQRVTAADLAERLWSLFIPSTKENRRVQQATVKDQSR